MDPARGRVLIIEDDEPLGQMVAIKLRQNGYETTLAPDGETALMQVPTFQPDLIIADHKLPGITGMKVAQMLGESPLTSTVPFILLTGRGFSIPRRDLEAPNVVRLISKPFSARQLVAYVNELTASVPER